MPINYPRLDDQDFESLLQSAMTRLKEIRPDWSGSDQSDPGVVLLEVFAYLTEQLLYRVNKMPEKSYVEFLNLLDASPSPPSAAYADLVFSLKNPESTPEPIVIPARTQVSLAGAKSDSPVFSTIAKVVLDPARAPSITVGAVHAGFVENEDLGTGTGEPGFTARVKNPPIVVDPLGLLSVQVAVETTDVANGEGFFTLGDRTFRVWEERENRSELDGEKYTYRVEPWAGIIRFALPLFQRRSNVVGSRRPGLEHRDKRILVSYYYGGGAGGNVSAHSLRTVLDPALATLLDVDNPRPATGGKDAETVEELIRRGPELIHDTDRLITAQDFTLEATRFPGIARALTHAETELWPFAEQGVVQVDLVPSIGLRPWESPESVFTDATLLERYGEAAKPDLLAAIDQRIRSKAVLGVKTVCRWARLKPVSVEATVVPAPLQSPQAIRSEILKALYAHFSLETNNRDKAFSLAPMESVGTAPLYTLIMGIRGVMQVRDLVFRLPETPDRGVRALESCPSPIGYLIAASSDGLYFTVDGGKDWQLLFGTPGEIVVVARAHRTLHGHFALVTHRVGEDSKVLESLVRFTRDNGQTWELRRLSTTIFDCAWVEIDVGTALLLASDEGLYRLDAVEHSLPRLLSVPDHHGGFYRVAAAPYSSSRKPLVIASSMGGDGVYLLTTEDNGRSWDVASVLFRGRDIRALFLTETDSRLWLWAGTTTTGDREGEGVFRCEATTPAQAEKTVVVFRAGWQGGSCRCIFADDERVFAGTHRRGVLSLDPSGATPEWETLPLECGLPLRDTERLFLPVNVLEKGPQGLLAGTEGGIFVRTDEGRFRCLSGNRRSSAVSLPKGWFFCSGLHRIDIEEYREG